jgi:hypothetical protein
LSKEEVNLIKLLVTLRDANAMVVGALSAYLEARAPPEVKIEKVQELFAEDLRSMLSFEAQPDDIIIKWQFLGSENFTKILFIVKESGGDYVSARKNSHFKFRRRNNE